VAIEAFARPNAGVHDGDFPYRKYAGVVLDEPLAAGENVVFRLSDMRMQTYEENVFNLRVAVLAGETDVVGYVGDATWSVGGGALDRLRVVAPTVVEAGERVDCRIVGLDEFENRAGERVSPDTLSLDHEGVEFEEIRSEGMYLVARGVHFPESGVYYLPFEADQNGGVRGRSNPIVVREKVDERIFWGDIHQHAYYNDGRNTPEESYHYARYTSLLDFGAVTPHSSEWVDWDELREATERFDTGEFSTLFGYEQGSASPASSAEVNIYHLNGDVESLRERLGRSVDGLADVPREALEEINGESMILPHAHSGGSPDEEAIRDWPEVMRSVEVCSVHGVFDEFYERWVTDGRRIGVNGGGDVHMTRMGHSKVGYHYVNVNGLTGLRATENTRGSIWEGYRDRKTYGVTGHERIFLEFRIDGQSTGSVLPPDGERHIEVSVAGTAPILRVDLVKNGDVYRRYRPDPGSADRLRLAWTDSVRGRRANESTTEGTIAQDGSDLRLEGTIHPSYVVTTRYREEDGDIAFRSNGYSGVTNGVLLSGADDGRLDFEIRDVRRGTELLDERFAIPLGESHVAFTRPFSQLADESPDSLSVPRFTLDVDWVDSDWPQRVDLAWNDVGGSEDHYYVRVEQVDGNVAWSSPIWFDAGRQGRVPLE
jgi:hypothetical protein